MFNLLLSFCPLLLYKSPRGLILRSSFFSLLRWHHCWNQQNSGTGSSAGSTHSTHFARRLVLVSLTLHVCQTHSTACTIFVARSRTLVESEIWSMKVLVLNVIIKLSKWLHQFITYLLPAMGSILVYKSSVGTGLADCFYLCDRTFSYHSDEALEMLADDICHKEKIIGEFMPMSVNPDNILNTSRTWHLWLVWVSGNRYTRPQEPQWWRCSDLQLLKLV